MEYFPPNGSYSLHYFPYYGKKAQVRGPQGPTAAAAREGMAGDACLRKEARLHLAHPNRLTSGGLPSPRSHPKLTSNLIFTFHGSP